MVYQISKQALIQMMSLQKKHFGIRYRNNRVTGTKRTRMISPKMMYPTHRIMKRHTTLSKIHMLLRKQLLITSSQKCYLNSNSLFQHKYRFLMQHRNRSRMDHRGLMLDLEQLSGSNRMQLSQWWRVGSLSW
jgi:hypothetical protein